MDVLPHHWLLLSLVALSIGPVVHQLAHRLDSMLAVLDGFVFVTIGGLTLLHLIPDSFERAGGWVLAWALVGFLGPGIIERHLQSMARPAHAVALLLAMVGIGLHAFMDGWALAGPAADDETHRHMLPMAILLHRLPVGLTIWFLLRPTYGLRLAMAALGLVAVATSFGFASGGDMAGRGWGWFQALVAGSLLHVVVHRSYPIVSSDVPSHRRHFVGGLGAVAGLVLLWTMAVQHGVGPVWLQVAGLFDRLARQSAPALLIAYLAAGVVFGLLPRASVAWLSGGGHLAQALRGMAFGLPIPICSCGVVPVYRSLVSQGVPMSSAIAFLIATPELSIDALMISLPLLGGQLTAARILAAALVALLVGWGMGKVASWSVVPDVARTEIGDQIQGGTVARLMAGLRISLGEVVDSTAPWILAGLTVAALVGPLVPNEWLAMPSVVEVGVFALVGIPTYVCASGATPLVAVLIYNGVSPGAAVAFLLTGPATNITTFGLLAQMHGRRLALVFGVAVVSLAIAMGNGLNLVLPDEVVSPLAAMETDSPGAWTSVCLFLIATLFLFSLIRQGPRAFVGELLPLGQDNDHEGNDQHSHSGYQSKSCSADRAADNGVADTAGAAR